MLEILGLEKKLKSVIVAELREVLKDYGDDRRTQIVDRVEEIKARRPDQRRRDGDYRQPCWLREAHFGLDVYRHRNRAAAKGASGAKARDDDFVEHFFVASAHSCILLFTSKGRIYWLKVYEIPEAAAATSR